MFQYTDYDRKVYETELKDFLPNEFIDCHVHVLEDNFPPAGDYNGGSTWTARVCTDLKTEELVEIYATLFPNKKVTPLMFGGCTHELTISNDYVSKRGAQLNFPTLFRTSYEMTPEYLEEEVKKGGFLGLKPYLSFCPSYIPSSEVRIYDFLPREHLEVADRNGWVVTLHIPRNMRLRDPLNLAQIMEIEEKYKNIKLIVAHIGRAYSKEDIGDAFELLKNTKNLVFDFSANVCDDAIKACIEAVGTDRLLFGTDLPIAYMRMYRIVENGVYYNVVPRGLYGEVSKEPHMRETDESTVTLMVYEQLRALKRVATELKLTDAQIENIMYLNAKKLFESVK